MLDPNFGKKAIPIAQRASAINLLKLKLIKTSTRVETSRLVLNEIDQ